MPKQFSSVEAAIEAFRQGKIVIVVDAEDRENEGDFVCAASAATTETVNFMLRHGRGQVCMSILPDVAKRPVAVIFNRTLPTEWAHAKPGKTTAALRDNLARWGAEALRQNDLREEFASRYRTQLADIPWQAHAPTDLDSLAALIDDAQGFDLRRLIRS